MCFACGRKSGIEIDGELGTVLFMWNFSRKKNRPREEHMNQKERMLAGLPYKAWLDGLAEERLENKKRIYKYNNLPPEAEKEQDELIKEILGERAYRGTVPLRLRV